MDLLDVLSFVFCIAVVLLVYLSDILTLFAYCYYSSLIYQ